MIKQSFWTAIDPEVLDRIGSRRDALAEATRIGRKVAMASVPVALAASASKVFAQGLPQNVVDILNFALTLEYLENEFYVQGLESGVIASADLSIFETIQAHEQVHVDFLRAQLGGQAVDKPEFDFTVDGAFDPFNVYAQFKLLAQGFEDTGVRAYKGQAPNLIGHDAVLEAALTIHSVEARHAARVRRLNGFQGWIPFDQPGVPAAFNAVYAGEDVSTQLGVDVTGISDVSEEGVTESFDEPLSMDAVLAIAGLFIES